MILAYRTSKERRDTSIDRRNALRTAERCINGPLTGSRGKRAGIVHGRVVSGGSKCQRCVDVHKGTAS